MKILRGPSTDQMQPDTSPFPVSNSIFVELRGGDFCHPVGDGNWFEQPFFTAARKFWLPLEITKALALFLCVLSLTAAVQLYQFGMSVWPFIFLLPAPFFNPGMFVSWRFGKHGGYIGAKIYGMDSPTYSGFAGADEVYSGSQALMFSIRPHANLN